MANRFALASGVIRHLPFQLVGLLGKLRTPLAFRAHYRHIEAVQFVKYVKQANLEAIQCLWFGTPENPARLKLRVIIIMLPR